MATLTIKNLPDRTYAKLTRAAKERRRSINSEAIVRLEQSLELEESNSEDLLARIRRNREEMKSKGVWITDVEITAAKNEGRP